MVSVAAPEAYLIQSVESVLLAIVALATDTCAMVQKRLAALAALALLALSVRSATKSTAQMIARISKTTVGSTQTQQLGAAATYPTSVHIQTLQLLWFKKMEMKQLHYGDDQLGNENAANARTL